jgi:hypothetical protein
LQVSRTRTSINYFLRDDFSVSAAPSVLVGAVLDLPRTTAIVRLSALLLRATRLSHCNPHLARSS